MLKKFLVYTTKLFENPKIVLIVAAVITVIMALGLLKLQLDNDFTHMVPETNPDRAIHDKMEKVFGSTAYIFVGVETDDIYSKKCVDYIMKLNDEFQKLNSIVPVENLSKYIGLSPEDTADVIRIISEMGIPDREKIKELFKDEKRLVSECSLSEEKARLISRKVSSKNVDEIIKFYNFPVKDIQSYITSDFVEGIGDKFIVKKIYEKDLPQEEAISLLKKRINTWDIYKGLIVSEDGKLATVMIQLYDMDIDTRAAVYRNVMKISQNIDHDGMKIYVDGEPVIADMISDYIMSDIRLLMPFVILVIMIMLYICFKNFEGVFYPTLAVLLSVIWAVGFMSYCGVAINVISTIMPVLLIATGSAYCIHVMNHYFLRKEKNKLTVFKKNMPVVGLAIAMSGLAAAIGFGSLCTSQFIPIRDFGIFTCIGSVFAIIIALYVIPAMILLSKREKTPFKALEGKDNLSTKFLKWCDRTTVNHHWMVIIISVVATILIGVFIFKLNVEINNISFFKKNAPIRIADDKLNDKLAGTQVISVVLESKDGSFAAKPELLADMEKFTVSVKEKYPLVKKTIDLSDYLKKMNQEMNAGNSTKYTIPETDAKIRDYLLLYSGNLDGVVTAEKDKLRLTMTIKRSSTKELVKVKEMVLSYFNKDFLDKYNLNRHITGYGNIYIVANDLIVDGQIESLFICLVIVFGIILFIFRRISLAIIGIIPIIFTIFINFGFMGIFDIPLNGGTAMVSSIAVGIGVDYAIHFITWYKSEIEKLHNINKAISATIMEKGRAILYNVIAVMIGFLVITFSNFVPLIQFGLLVSLCMLTTGIGALLVVPSVIIIYYNRKGVKAL